MNSFNLQQKDLQMYAFILFVILSAIATTATTLFSYQSYGVFYHSPLLENTVMICGYYWFGWFLIVDTWLYDRIPNRIIVETPIKIVPFNPCEESQKILAWHSRNGKGKQQFHLLEDNGNNESVIPLTVEISEDSVRVIEDSTLTDTGSITRIYSEKDGTSTLRNWLIFDRFTFDRTLGRTELRVPVGSIRQRN